MNILFFGTYKNTDTPIKMKHNICQKEFLMRPACFIRGQRCPNCFRSIGCEKIQSFLERNNVLFEREKTFDDLKDRRLLRFDFWLKEQNVLIEFDGEQHFRQKSFGGNQQRMEKEFEVLLEHDSMKNQYCQNNKITFLRIPYWNSEFVDEILMKFLELLKVKESNSFLLNNFINDVFSKKFKK